MFRDVMLALVIHGAMDTEHNRGLALADKYWNEARMKTMKPCSIIESDLETITCPFHYLADSTIVWIA